jgi:dTDP-4-dehydrorhamnose reductase
MIIAVTGAEGQLARDIVAVMASRHHVIAWNRRQLDVTDPEAIRAAVLQQRPDVIIHAGAFTQVDRAEEDVRAAYAVNAVGTGHLAETANRIDAKFIYISTDYVFDGLKGSPYTEEDKTNPLNVYGASKRLGEQFTANICRKHFIIRTAWLFSNHGSNFAKRICSLSKHRESTQAAVDLVGSPTYTVDLARFLAFIVETERYGTYHAVNDGYCSKYQFALEILHYLDQDSKLIKPVRCAELQLAARRPLNSSLYQKTIIDNGFEPLRDWRMALHEFLQRGC